MISNERPGDDGDWTDTNTRDLAAELFAQAIRPHHEALAVTWSAQARKSLAIDATPEELAEDYERLRAGMISTVERVEMREALAAARQFRAETISAKEPV